MGHPTDTPLSLAVQIFGICVMISIAVILIILFPAIFYYYCEPNWSYLTAIYYCTLTLATAGLGDFVPTKSE